MKWSDLLRVKAEFPINLWPNAAQAYHRWIRTCIKENMPYDRFVRELLTASGSNFRVPPVNFYRAVQSREPQAIAQAVALTFMGARAEKWPKERLAGMAAFFSQVGYKSTARVEGGDRLLRSRQGRRAGRRRRAAGGGLSRRHAGAALAGPGSARGLRRLADRRRRIPGSRATSSTASGPGCWGAASSTSRTTSGPDNPPSNPELLAYLERELVAAHYDLKHLYRLILNSKTYQLSSIPRTDSPEGDGQFRATIRCAGWRRRC